MQIGTRNRDCGVTSADINNCSKFAPGPEPRQARYGLGTADTNCSGLLERPCNSRYGGELMFYPDSKTNLIDHQYKLGYDVCKTGEAASEASSCFAGVQNLGINASHFVNQSVSDQHLPPVCSLTRLANDAVVHFNNGHKGNCSPSSKHSGDGSSKVGVKVKIELDSSGMFKMLLAGQCCSQIRASKMATFEMKSLTLQAAQEARDQCQEYCWKASGCWGCNVDCSGLPMECHLCMRNS